MPLWHETILYLYKKMDSPWVKYCLYHREINGNFYSYISMPRVFNSLEEVNVKNQYCTNAINEWKCVGVFYALSSFIRPIPVGMNLFRSIISPSYPYGTIDFISVFDMFNITEMPSVNFLAYTTSFKGTIPLYIYKLASDGNDDQQIFISFDENPPSEYWIRSDINSVHVLLSPINNFRCLENKVIPYGENSFYEAYAKCYTYKKKNWLIILTYFIFLFFITKMILKLK